MSALGEWASLAQEIADESVAPNVWREFPKPAERPELVVAENTAGGLVLSVNGKWLAKELPLSVLSGRPLEENADRIFAWLWRETKDTISPENLALPLPRKR